MTEKGTSSYLTKELLASTVLQMNAKAQWEVAGHSGQSQGFAQNTGAVRHPSSHRSGVHHLPHLSTRTCSCPLPLMCTDRQAGRQANWVSHSSTSFRGVTKQLWEQETAVGTEMWTLTEGSAILWLSWPKAAAKGLFCHWKVIVKQSFGFHSSALPLLRNLSQCSRRTPGRAEHSLMSFLFPWGRGHFLKGTIAQLGQGRHMVFELCLASDDSVQAFSSFGFLCHHSYWAKSSKFL